MIQKTAYHSKETTFDQADYYKALMLEDLQRGITFIGTKEELDDLHERLYSYIVPEDEITAEWKSNNELYIKYLINARVSNQ